MREYGLFNDEASVYTAEEAVEAGFYSLEEAQQALAERYDPEDELTVHRIEEEAADDEEE